MPQYVQKFAFVVKQFKFSEPYNMIPFTDNMGKIWSKLPCTNVLVFNCLGKNLNMQIVQKFFHLESSSYVKFLVADRRLQIKY